MSGYLIRWVKELKEREDERVREARAALVEQLERRRVGEPITATLLGVTFFHFLAGVAISVGLSVGTGLLMGALQKRQKVTQGDRGGQEIGITRVAQGTPVPEIFGGDPGDGLGGGVKLAPIILWLSRTSDGYVARKHVQRSSGSGGGKLGGPKAPDVTTITYDLDVLFEWCRGPATLKKLWAATDIILRADFNSSVNYYQAEDGGNALTGGASVVADAGASGGQAVLLPISGGVQFNGVAGDGSPIQVEFYLKSSTDNSVELNFVGDVFDDKVRNTGGNYAAGYQSLPFVLALGSHSIIIKNLSATPLYIDRLAIRFSNDPTGVPDPTRPQDSSYDPNIPHDPNIIYDEPQLRLGGELLVDHGVRSLAGTVAGGNFANIALYEGNGTELPDPIVQAQWDTQMGAGSTPAFRQVCTTRLSNFYLTRYQEAFPPFWGLLEHKTIRTFKDLCEYLCAQSGLEPDEYDFTDLATINLRGVVISPPYTARELMTTLGKIFNCYFYEADRLYGKRMESAPTLALTDADLGWTDDDPADIETIQLLDTELPSRTDIARRVTIRYISPARNYEQQSLSEVRQITTSQKEDTLDIQVTATEEEARIYAARELHLDEVESVPYSFTLSCEHLWRHPGTLVTITQTDGTVHYMRLVSIKPTLGIIDCQGVQVDEPLFTQFGTPADIVFEIPPVPIPASTMLAFLDMSALRTEDDGVPGFYAYAVARTGPGGWPSAVLYKEVQEETPTRVVVFDKQAVAGRTVTVLGPVADITIEDSIKIITVNSTTERVNLTAHDYLNGETVMFSNSGGALPGGLLNTTLYYIINSTTNDFQVSLTAGGSVVNITSAGTGTNYVQRVLDVDLYGTTATLSSATVGQIADGANPCVFGNECLQVRTWERVGGFSNRWRGRDFTRGLRDTSPSVFTHVLNERMVVLDDAVKHIAQTIGELNTTRTYRAVTAGQSYDDAAEVVFTWTGGTLFYPYPGISATKDTLGNWRFLLKGVLTKDPEGERYKLLAVGSPRDPWILRGGVSRPVSLTSGPPLGGVIITLPEKGSASYSLSDIPGNSISDDAAAYVKQLLRTERTTLSFTYLTGLTLSSSAESGVAVVFTSAVAGAMTLLIQPQTSVDAPELTIFSASTGTLYSQGAAEASGTRFHVEFVDGKIKFYRNDSGEPFFVCSRAAVHADFGFPIQVEIAVPEQTTADNIEVADEYAALNYTVDEQVEDFGSVQSSITVRACQQRVVQGIIIDGQVVEATFP